MPAAPRLDRDASLLLVVDVQTRLAPHVEAHEALITRAGALLDAAHRFAIPRRLTEHCAEQIGPVVPMLRERFAADEIFAKTRFGAADHPEFTAALRGTGRTQIVIAGMEAHVCAMQTSLGLIERGFAVFAVTDALGSRAARRDDRRMALERLRAAGAVLTATETVLFEWTRDGTDPAFRDVLALVKRLP